jgi:ElaB/YqjD/DUF883 family membrane-anchored ribosome-binding protein
MANRDDAFAADAPKSMNRGSASTLGEQSGRVAAEARELGHMALASAGDALKHAKERGTDLLDSGRVRLEDAKDGFGRYVGENPFKSVLIAAGVGALIGIMLRSRR